MVRYKPAEALREHILDGNPVTQLEAILLFGVQNPNAEFTRIKKSGFVMSSRPVPMAKVIRRLNEMITVTLPEELPYKEITLTEYWVQL